MCVSYEKTKGKFPGEHHMICGGETKFISLTLNFPSKGFPIDE